MDFTNCSFTQFRCFKVEYIVLMSAIFVVDGFNVETEFLNKRARVAGASVWIRIPRQFLDNQGRFG